MSNPKPDYNLDRKYAFLISLIRFIASPAIFYSPYLTSIVILILDWSDGEVFKRAGFTQARYLIYDKVQDSWWYLMIIFYVFINKVPLKEFFLLLFLYRLLGQILFFFTKRREVFFFFPNFFEVVFYFYLLSLPVTQLKLFMAFPKILYPLAFIVPGVLIREYVLHIKKANLSWFFTGNTTYWLDEK